MYVPQHFEESDVTVIHRLMRAHPLGAVVTLSAGGLDANHIPFVLHHEPAPFGTLHGHVARPNAMWRSFSPAVDALVIFQGPEAFISPSWYPSKRETAKVVPTWNYAVVHAHGPLRVIDDPAWVRAHVEELTNGHESGRPAPWKVTDAPADYIDRLVGGIVGLEISITRLIGKWKVSQNRSESDRNGVIAALTREGNNMSAAMADLVRQTNDERSKTRD